MDGKHNKNNDEAEAEDELLKEIQAMRANPSCYAEDLDWMHDDACWPSLPGDPFGKITLPTIKTVLRQVERYAAKFDVDRKIIEYYFLRRLRETQSSYGRVATLFEKLDRETGSDFKKSLDMAIVGTFCLGRSHPPEERMAKVREGRAAKWHKAAIARAVEIRKKHPDPKTYSNFRIAKDIYEQLKDMTDGPSSNRAVDKVLVRKLWTTEQ